MEDKKPRSSDVFFNNKLLLIDVRTRLNPDNKNLVRASTQDQGRYVAKLMRGAFVQLNLQVQLDFTNVIPISPGFLKGLLGDLVQTNAGNHLLNRIKFRGCGSMIHGMWNAIIEHSRAQYIELSDHSPKSR